MKNSLKNFLYFKEQELNKFSHSRVIFIAIIFICFFIILALKMFSIVMLDSKQEVNQSLQAKYTRRGEIFDRNGEVLAVNLGTASLYARPMMIQNYHEVSKQLVNILPDVSYEELIKDFTSGKKFFWIKRNLTPKQQYAINSLGVPGLSLENVERRVYLHGNILSHILGYVDIDGKGIAGVEKYFDKYLSNEIDEKHEYRDIKLSIDIRVQDIIYDIAKTAFNHYNADGISAILMDARNGEIYSILSLPDFDPHMPNLYSKDELFSRTTLGTFELGSIFKAISFAMALDAQAVDLEDAYYIKNPIKTKKFQINDYGRKKKDWLSVPEIFMYSSNIGTGRIALELGTEKQQEYLEKLGFFEKTSLEVPELGVTLFPELHKWNDLNTITISYGHGIAMTSVHFLQAFAATVNGGYLNQATILKDNKANNTTSKKVFMNETSEKMQKLLRLVVEKGTGRLANAEGYFVGGKTGSADKAKKGGYHDNNKISTFAAAFPIYDPKFVLFLSIDNPKAEHKYTTIAGRSVAPLAKEIINKVAPVLEIKPEKDVDGTIKNYLDIDYQVNLEDLDDL